MNGEWYDREPLNFDGRAQLAAEQFRMNCGSISTGYIPIGKLVNTALDWSVPDRIDFELLIDTLIDTFEGVLDPDEVRTERAR